MGEYDPLQTSQTLIPCYHFLNSNFGFAANSCNLSLSLEAMLVQLYKLTHAFMEVDTLRFDLKN